MLRGKSQFMIYFILILELDLSCTPILSNMECNIIQIIAIIVTLNKIVISVMESMAHTSLLNFLLDHQILFLFHENS
jgi:hypothetical protein